MRRDGEEGRTAWKYSNRTGGERISTDSDERSSEARGLNAGTLDRVPVDGMRKVEYESLSYTV
jgi:hypothetical protein